MVRHHRGVLKPKRLAKRGYLLAQTGKTTFRVDAKRRAKGVGWRKTGKSRVWHPAGFKGKKTGMYFEDRANRSDKIQAKKAKLWL